MLGYAHFGRKDYARAVEAFEKTLEMGLNEVEIYYDLAATYLILKNFDKALAAAETARQREPERAYPHFLAGRVHFENSRFAEAVAPLQRALEIDPKFTAARLTLGQVYKGAGDAAKAREAFQEVLKLEPENPAARKELESLGPAPAAA